MKRVSWCSGVIVLMMITYIQSLSSVCLLILGNHLTRTPVDPNSSMLRHSSSIIPIYLIISMEVSISLRISICVSVMISTSSRSLMSNNKRISIKSSYMMMRSCLKSSSVPWKTPKRKKTARIISSILVLIVTFTFHLFLDNNLAN